MTEPRILQGLGEIAGDYDAILCDAWGVIHNGRELFPGVAEALTSFRRERGPVLVLTNAPRPSNVIPAQLDRLGLPRDAYDGVVTSGDATMHAAHSLGEKIFYRIGPAKDDGLFDAMNLKLGSFEEAEAIFCSGLEDDLTETPEDYRDLLEKAAKRDLPMVVANPDIVVRFGDRMMFCAGALGELYEQMGGTQILGGKPHAPIYDLARDRLAKIAGAVPERILVIGDGLGTDILGANNQDLPVVFIAEGIFSEEVRGEDGKLSAEKLSAELRAQDVYAAFGMDTLAW